MRHIKNILFVLSLLGAVVSCTEDNMDSLGDWKLTNPEITEPSTGAVILDENTPAANITFSWNEAVSSARYQIRYSVVIDTAGSTSFDTPILKVQSENGGKDNSAAVIYDVLDEALAIAGYPEGLEVALTWAVIADCVGTIGTDSETINVTRFASKRIPNTLYLSGTATENGDNLSTAIELKKHIDTVNIFEVFTHLDAEGDFKFYSKQSTPAFVYGADGSSIKVNGVGLEVEESGEYLVRINLDDDSYSLTKIDRMAVIGSPFANQWSSDEALEYQGAGIWQGQVDFVGSGGFAFRANNSWDYLLKHIDGTENQLIVESFANQYGVSYHDLETDKSGVCSITLDLSAAGYTYTIESSGTSGGEPIPTPDALFLLDDGGNKICEFTKDGDVFTSDIYLALQQSMSYTLNSAEDGSGTSYILNANLGATENAGADKVMGSTVIKEGGDGTISVDADQAYSITVDCSTGEISWFYYNLKVFHWDDAGGGWDDRTETVMTYSHPYIFAATMDMYAGFDTKFNSPWEVEFGAKQGTDDRNAASGTSTNKGLQDDVDTYPNENFLFITSDGNYTATIVVAEDFKTADYTIVSN